MSKIEIILNRKKQQQRVEDTQPTRGPLNVRQDAEYLPRRNKGGVLLNFWDLGQVWNGSAWEDLDFVASPAITQVNTGSDPPYFDTVASLTAADWTAYKNKLFEIPVENWDTSYKKVEYAEGFRYGFDVYLGDPATVNPASQPTHLELSKYYGVSSQWQRPPVDVYLQRRSVLLFNDHAQGAVALKVGPLYSDSMTLTAGTKIHFTRSMSVVVTADTTVTGSIEMDIPVTPLSTALLRSQRGTVDDIQYNKTAWSPEGLLVQPSDHFSLVTLNAFMNIGLWFDPKITALPDAGEEEVPFKIDKNTDFFLVPALVGNEHIGAWDAAGPFSFYNNSYLNYDYRPWSRENFLTTSYFETTRSYQLWGTNGGYPPYAPFDCPVFAKSDYTYWYEGSDNDAIPKPPEWEEILTYYKTATAARQFKENNGVGLTTVDDFAVAPQATVWLAGFAAYNFADINPISYGYVTPGALLAVARQGSSYFYFWYTGSQKINTQYSLSTVMQEIRLEYNYPANL